MLVAVVSRDAKARWRVEDSIAELKQLTATAGVEVVSEVIQRLKSPSKTLYMGRGRLDELVAQRVALGYNVVIFDDELSPVQQRNLEEALKVKVIDRTALILDIFARRAHTREGSLQVELAQHQYLLPRLAGQWSHLERLGGGIGTRGPGEAQIETDRRLIRKKIHRLKARLEAVRKQRALYRTRRHKSGIPVVALVGYTNAGKSTLLNALSRADVFVEDKLFATLDPTTRRIALGEGGMVLLTDTVGFISKLPPTIVSAFRATLEELSQAALLVHVVNITSHNAAEQCETVEDILKELGLADRPRITALNKIDLLLDNATDWDEKSAIKHLAEILETPMAENTVLVSAQRRWGLNSLSEMISRTLADISLHP